MWSPKPVPRPSVGCRWGAGWAPAPGASSLLPTHAHPLLLQVSTHLHPSSEDEDMEGVFPNELSLQQVRVARPFPAVLASLRPLGVPRHLTKLPREMARGAVLLAPVMRGTSSQAIYMDGALGDTAGE